MLFSYTLLFFLPMFTFVAAAPTMKLQKRYGTADFTNHQEILTARGGVWTRDESASEPHNSPVNEITWLIKNTEDLNHPPIKKLFVKVGDNTIDVDTLEVVKAPGSDLVGTWERKATGSRIQIFDPNLFGHKTFFFRIDIDGKWRNEVAKKQEPLPEPDLNESQQLTGTPQSTSAQLATPGGPPRKGKKTVQWADWAE